MGRVPPTLTNLKAQRQNKTCEGAGYIFQLIVCYIATEISPYMKGMILDYQNKIIGKHLTSVQGNKSVISTNPRFLCFLAFNEDYLFSLFPLSIATRPICLKSAQKSHQEKKEVLSSKKNHSDSCVLIPPPSVACSKSLNPLTVFSQL